MWKSKKPEATGWYVWRSFPGAEPEIVHVWKLGPTDGNTAYGSPDSWPMAYGWVVPTHSKCELYLAKRAHAPASMVDEDIGGEYLYDGATPVNALEAAIGPKAKNPTAEQSQPAPKRKTVEKKSPEADGSPDRKEAGGAGPVPVKPPGSL